MTVGSCFVLGRALAPVTYADYFNHELEALEESGEDIDLLMVGDSRLYSAFDSRIFEEKMGLDNVFVASTSSQPICGSYYMIKDYIERFHPKKIILGLDCDEMIEDARVQAMLLVIDQLSMKNKLQMFRHCFFGTDLFYMLDLYRYRNNLDDLFTLIKDRQELVSSDYVQEDDGVQYYCYKGFIARHGEVTTGTMPMYFKSSFDEEMMIPFNLDYFQKCVDICKENGIELELVSAPTSVMRMYYTDHYDEGVKYYERFARENGLIYRNLNYLKDRETILPDEMMCDFNHTNIDGAKVVSEIYADILLKEEKGEDVSDLFYSSFEDFCADVHRIVSVDAKIRSEDDGYHLELRSLHNPDVTVSYQIEIREEGKGGYQIIVPWTKESEHVLDVEKGRFEIRITARSGKASDGMAYQEYSLDD
jgi:hypothetical protein